MHSHGAPHSSMVVQCLSATGVTQYHGAALCIINRAQHGAEHRDAFSHGASTNPPNMAYHCTV